MNVIKNRDLEKEERNLREKFYGTGIQFYREGNGIDSPITMIIGFPSIRNTPDEVASISEKLMAAVICCRSSPCSAAGSTTRAAATGSTEPERLRQLSSVAHHIANAGKLVTFCHQFRDVTKLLLCGVHPGGVTEMAVCSACHDILLTAFPMPLSCGRRKIESPCSWSLP